ncbi:MAG TPA: hydrogenase maturation protease [bacterium]|jgi:hydrogenase maturation protease
MKTVVLGLGNPLLHDDGAGIEAVKMLKGQVGSVELRMAAVGGLRILDQLQGFDHAIIVDAIMTGGTSGEVRRFAEGQLAGDLHASCAHDLSFREALTLGRSMGMELPHEIIVYGIEVADPYQLEERCSPSVQDGAREAARLIREELGNLNR